MQNLNILMHNVLGLENLPIFFPNCIWKRIHRCEVVSGFSLICQRELDRFIPLIPDTPVWLSSS